MAVKSYSLSELIAELETLGFSRTGTFSDESQIFEILKNKNNDCISVNMSQDTYPYFYLNELIKPFSKSSYNFSGTKSLKDEQTYTITPDKPVV